MTHNSSSDCPALSSHSESENASQMNNSRSATGQPVAKLAKSFGLSTKRSRRRFGKIREPPTANHRKSWRLSLQNKRLRRETPSRRKTAPQLAPFFFRIKAQISRLFKRRANQASAGQRLTEQADIAVHHRQIVFVFGLPIKWIDHHDLEPLFLDPLGQFTIDLECR